MFCVINGIRVKYKKCFYVSEKERSTKYKHFGVKSNLYRKEVREREGEEKEEGNPARGWGQWPAGGAGPAGLVAGFYLVWA